jgi:hypothetical protein
MAGRRRTNPSSRTAHQKLERKVKGPVRQRAVSVENSAKQCAADDYGARLLALKGSVPEDVVL